MRIIQFFAFCLFAGLLANSAGAQPTLLLSNESSGKTPSVSDNDLRRNSPSSRAEFAVRDNLIQNYSLDFISEDDPITSMTLSLDISNEARVDVTNCLSGLPQTHTGVCERVGNKIKIAIFSMSNQEIPAGTIGQLSVSGNAVLTIDENTVSLSTASADSVKAEVLQ